MSIVIDTGVFYAHADADAQRHESAFRALDLAIDGEFGQPYTSDYIYDETVTLTRERTGRFALAKTVGRRIRGSGPFPDLVRLEHVTPAVFDQAVDVFERYADRKLSFTDATTVALLETHDVDAVLSFDDDFDGIVERRDPAQLPA